MPPDLQQAKRTTPQGNERKEGDDETIAVGGLDAARRDRLSTRQCAIHEGDPQRVQRLACHQMMLLALLFSRAAMRARIVTSQDQSEAG